ncbi:hypothetical protein N7471_012590 [Penicillium samsonianum]|uniref:uncharacterized protein n=1 Tax=Penicillium samsonianum TaxID=1882272 RepID=UPI002547FA57|nr:uncharacterized protein N7471_012590 [Penicillium samsonianum]KAJ6125273.1 hypothetical protein N7471_012590 [Penicillium samsonianum]
MCGKEVEQVVLPDKIYVSAHSYITFMLHNVECRAWVEHDGSRILRLFIQSPSPLSELWSSNGRTAHRITSIFRFISRITRVKLCPTFFESTLVVTLVLIGWYDEKLGRIPPIGPQDLDPLLRIWLAEKGFQSEMDLLRLTEAAGGSLRRGIHIMCSNHPNRAARRLGTPSRGVRRSQTRKEYDHCPPEIFGRVLALFEEKAPHLFLVSRISSYPRKQDLEPIGEAMDEAMDEAMEDSLIGKAMGLRISPPEAQETPISIPNLSQLGEPAGGFWVKAELSCVGERHPHVWATNATLEDPGSRLAIRIRIRDSDGREIATEYPSSDTWQACYKANRIVDELNGDSCLEISKRPRRHIFVDARHKGLLRRHPELEIFVGGAFTGNNGEFISTKRPKRPREGKETPKESDKEGHKKFKQEETESDA